jgi:hypothetical protein
MITELVAVDDFGKKVCFDESEGEGSVTNREFGRKKLVQEDIKRQTKSCVQKTR